MKNLIITIAILLSLSPIFTDTFTFTKLKPHKYSIYCNGEISSYCDIFQVKHVDYMGFTKIYTAYNISNKLKNIWICVNNTDVILLMYSDDNEFVYIDSTQFEYKITKDSIIIDMNNIIIEVTI